MDRFLTEFGNCAGLFTDQGFTVGTYVNDLDIITICIDNSVDGLFIHYMSIDLPPSD